MPASPVCQIRDGSGPWVDTTNGVDVTPGNTIHIRLSSTTGVVDWFLFLRGTDEEIAPGALVLSGVDPVTGRAPTPSSEASFDMPASFGHAVLIESKIRTLGGTYVSTTLGIYVLTTQGLRVGAVGETREGNVNFGWADTVNAAIRNIGHGGGGSGEDLERTYVAGENIGAGVPVAISSVDGRIYAADAAVSDRKDVRGFTKASVLSGATTAVVSDGAFTYSPGGLTRGTLYLAVGGGFSHVPPSLDTEGSSIVSLGYAVDASTILVDIDPIAET